MKKITISPDEKIQKHCHLLERNGGGILELLPGIYNEDIVLPKDVVIQGSGLADLDFTVIRGSHVLPQNGKIGFSYLKLENKNSIFVCKKDCDCTFLFYSCCLEVDDGWALEIPHFKGKGTFFDGWIKGKKNGFVNNTDGKGAFKFYNLTSESQDKKAEMILPYKSKFFGVHITHKVILSKDPENYSILGASELENLTLNQKNE